MEKTCIGMENPDPRGEIPTQEPQVPANKINSVTFFFQFAYKAAFVSFGSLAAIVANSLPSLTPIPHKFSRPGISAARLALKSKSSKNTPPGKHCRFGTFRTRYDESEVWTMTGHGAP